MSYLNAEPRPTDQEPAIRRAGPGDAEALAEIGAATFSATFGHLYPPQDLAAFLAEAHSVARHAKDAADPTRAVWLAEADGRAVGYAIAGPCGLPHAEVTPACGELKCLYVRQGWQGGGLGGRLFSAALDWLQQRHADLWIGVWSENYGAQRFYGRAGFEKVGEYGFVVGETVDREFILRRKSTVAAPPTT